MSIKSLTSTSFFFLLAEVDENHMHMDKQSWASVLALALAFITKA